jgi:hypothetical protein
MAFQFLQWAGHGRGQVGHCVEMLYAHDGESVELGLKKQGKEAGDIMHELKQVFDYTPIIQWPARCRCILQKSDSFLRFWYPDCTVRTSDVNTVFFNSISYRAFQGFANKLSSPVALSRDGVSEILTQCQRAKSHHHRNNMIDKHNLCWRGICNGFVAVRRLPGLLKRK